MPMAWLRYYVDDLNDATVQQLSPEIFKAWVNILCVARMHNGTLPEVAHIAFAMRTDTATITRYLAVLTSAHLLVEEHGTYRPRDWDKRQYESDSSTSRVARHRQSKRDVTLHVAFPTQPDATLPVTHQNRPDTDQMQTRPDADQIRRQTSPPTPSRGLPGERFANPSLPLANQETHDKRDLDFRMFLMNYPPHKRDEDEARKEWVKAVAAGEIPQMAQLSVALKNYKESPDWIKENGRFVQKASNFIKGRLWLTPPQINPNMAAPGKFVE